jgi:hypothetical protein
VVVAGSSGLFLDVASSLGLCLAVADSLGLCLVVAGSLWFVIIPKSKDRFMSRYQLQLDVRLVNRALRHRT